MTYPRAEAAASATTYRSFFVFVFFYPLRSLQSQQPIQTLNMRGAKSEAAPLRYFKGEVHTEGGGGGGGDGSFTGRLFLKGGGGVARSLTLHRLTFCSSFRPLASCCFITVQALQCVSMNGRGWEAVITAALKNDKCIPG